MIVFVWIVSLSVCVTGLVGQVQKIFAQGTGTSLSVTFPASSTAGNTLVVSFDTTKLPIMVEDNGGNLYTEQNSVLNWNGSDGGWTVLLGFFFQR